MMRTVSAGRGTQVHVGRNISLLLAHDRLHIKTLAARLDMDPSLVSRRLSGDIGMEIDDLARVAEALEVADVCSFFLSPSEFLQRARPNGHADNASFVSSPDQLQLLADIDAA